MKQIMTLQTYEQLKSLSDPFKAEMMMRLIEKAYTGQQLSEYFKVSRSHIHYHLKDLERNNLIEIVRTEEKNGIVQKFYKSVARGFTPSEKLLPHVEEIGESSRQILVQMIETTKSKLLSAPAESFSQKKAGKDPSEWSSLSSIWEISATEEQFQSFLKDFFNLVNAFQEKTKHTKDQSNKNLYHLSAFGFQIDEETFEGQVESDEED